ncbi:hypothetical protein F4802DRAFT_181675 [Xylaria palmicola]|nr:hypothetical protein F4802DRAFT_181675 [Xylaria palmicola]
MESVKKGQTLIPTPKGFIAVRVVQIVVALIALALSGYLIHGYYADPQGIAIASAIFTWIIALYAILTEHSAGCRPGYNTWAVLSLDFFMIILWLASLGSNAAYRASFVTSVNADCYDDGSTVNAGHCVIYKRAAVAGPTGRAVISAVAGVSAIMLLLFVVTFAYVAHHFRLAWAQHSGGDVEKAPSGYAPPGAAHVPVAQAETLVAQPQPQWAQQQHQPNVYPTSASPYDPYAPQHTGYAGAQGVYNQTMAQPLSHELPSPHGTPAPGQPYYPPQ